MDDDLMMPSERRVIASYATYEEAERAVDLLSDRGFAVENVAIEGRGLRIVEQVTGRMTYGTAALQGIGTGALIGLILGLLFWALSWFAPAESVLPLLIWGLLIGAFWGLVFGLLTRWMSHGRRDFSSIRGMEADRYDVTADPATADDAVRILSDRDVATHGVVGS